VALEKGTNVGENNALSFKSPLVDEKG